MNCLIIDDEPLAQEILEDYIKKIPFLTLLGKTSNAFEALNFLNEKPIDLIFLDIQMNGISGIEFAKSLEKKPMIVFTTAYEKYAIDGFSLNAVDYLLKPISFERFLKAVNRSFEFYKLIQQKSQTQNEPPSMESDFLFVKSEYSKVKVIISQIRRIEGLKDYVKIYTDNHYILSLTSIKYLEGRLKHNGFIRIHRSHLVAIKYIDSVFRNRIEINNTILPVGDIYKENFFKIIDKFN